VESGRHRQRTGGAAGQRASPGEDRAAHEHQQHAGEAGARHDAPAMAPAASRRNDPKAPNASATRSAFDGGGAGSTVGALTNPRRSSTGVVAAGSAATVGFADACGATVGASQVWNPGGQVGTVDPGG